MADDQTLTMTVSSDALYITLPAPPQGWNALSEDDIDALSTIAAEATRRVFRQRQETVR